MTRGTSVDTNPEALVVLVTAPAESVEAMAEALVEERLAACANLLPGVRSIYRWEGSVERDEEVLMLLKTTRAAFEDLTERVLELHPYDTPEVIALPVAAGASGYLDWVAGSTTRGG